jgi:hypothetical protein
LRNEIEHEKLLTGKTVAVSETRKKIKKENFEMQWHNQSGKQMYGKRTREMEMSCDMRDHESEKLRHRAEEREIKNGMFEIG